MTVMAAFREGVRRVASAPLMLAGIFAASLAVAAPMTFALQQSLRAHLGQSLAAESALAGANYDWWQEYSAQADGFERTFTPAIMGVAATLQNVSGILDREGLPAGIAWVTGAYLLLWVFLSGAVIDRYARGHATGVHGFFSTAGVFFFRFLRLGLLAGLFYLVLFRYVHAWLFDSLYERVTHDVAVERTAFLIRLGLYLVFGAVLLAGNLVLDYAKIRAVVEDRRSMIGAVLAGGRFVRRHAAKASGLYLLNASIFVLFVLTYGLVAPEAGGAGAAVWLGFLLGQLYLLARLALKLQFYASQTALFQSELAHAAYTAAPQPVWPESPAAEAIGSPGP